MDYERQLQPQTIRLTNRELRIVRLLFDGLSNPEIAHRLNLNPLTVRNYISRLLRKFGARNGTELLAKVIDSRRHQHRRLQS